MEEPIVVEATRGDVVEARHRAHAVAVAGGEIVGAAGDPQLVTYFRSSAKPIQALPVVRARPDLGEAEIAIACASHLARPEQLDAVRALLARRPTRPRTTSSAAREPTRLAHNCSGKHAGLLALCRSNGWPIEPATGFRPPLPAGAAGGGRGRRGGRSGVDADRRRRLRDRHVRAAARADGARVLALPHARRLGEDRRRHAGVPGADPRARRGRHRPHADAGAAGSRRAARRVCSAPARRTGSESP